MRTNIEINNKLMGKAKRLSRLKTKKEIVNTALEMYVRNLDKRSIKELKGKIKWIGSLDKMRQTG
ncbi:MAG TPA: type II toxin-antitoxin system VapB family antitoxin [Ignavibacteria bacterium]|nr:type II toxin-antitoxin system VapB family antitoxin [Ignavibacteria bacterium]HMQ99991.1 type II toxin-antitoxin system VapB family antitoxin [Ignavibacteria bacterium]